MEPPPLLREVASKTKTHPLFFSAFLLLLTLSAWCKIVKLKRLSRFVVEDAEDLRISGESFPDGDVISQILRPPLFGYV